MLLDIIQTVDDAAREKFYPDLANNLELPEAERAGFLIKRCSERELRAISDRLNAKFKVTKKTSKQAYRTAVRQSEAVTEAVIEKYAEPFGWKAKVDGSEPKAIATIAELRETLGAWRGHAIEVRDMWSDLYEAIVKGSTPDEDLLGE